MKAYISLLLITLQAVCSGQNEIRAVLDAVFTRTKQTSLYTSIVNWDSLQKEVYREAVHATTIRELKPAFEALLNGLNDKHGRILHAGDYSTIAAFTAFDKLNHPDKRIRDPATWKIVNDTALQFEYKMLAGKTGYLRIVAIPPNADIHKEAQRIRTAVKRLANLKAKKWIIDLRYNGGGNMHPMVSGIAPIIGDGKTGCLKNLEGEKLFDWEIKSGNFIYAGYQAIDLPNEPQFNYTPKVAVLTSRWTVSSGEVVATCFKGRPNTKFFGEMTGSFTTNNNWEIINDLVILNISTGIFCDRNGISYEYNIPVDAEIPFDPANRVENDKCITEALKWLRAK